MHEYHEIYFSNGLINTSFRHTVGSKENEIVIIVNSIIIIITTIIMISI